MNSESTSAGKKSEASMNRPTEKTRTSDENLWAKQAQHKDTKYNHVVARLVWLQLLLEHSSHLVHRRLRRSHDNCALLRAEDEAVVAAHAVAAHRRLERRAHGDER